MSGAESGTSGKRERPAGATPDAAAVGRMLGSPRCGARTRSGGPCRAPAVAGRARCRKHGGAAGSGGQPGNRNGLKDGYYSGEEKARRLQIMDFVRECNRVLKALDGIDKKS
jgi:glucans biosynthesis protein